MTTRLSIDSWAMEIARLVARRSTCLRRSVGCVLTDARGRILSTGYNGVASGQPHCNEWTLDDDGHPSYPHACPGANAKSGTRLDECHAIHAEQNALLQCRDVDSVATCYATTPPCVTCARLLLGTSATRVVFDGDYPHAVASRDLWTRAGRLWIPFRGE